jgi:MOSC domain-containing protein YiiM
MRLVEHATVRAGRGVQGDRYFDGRGTFSNRYATGVDLTLIEGEALDDLVLPSGRLAPEEARRNVVTRGIDLNALVATRFCVDDVACVGRRLCEPCAHLQRLTHPDTLRGLVHRGGLRADVLSDGVIHVGDRVERVRGEAPQT